MARPYGSNETRHQLFFTTLSEHDAILSFCRIYVKQKWKVAEPVAIKPAKKCKRNELWLVGEVIRGGRIVRITATPCDLRLRLT